MRNRFLLFLPLFSLVIAGFAQQPEPPKLGETTIKRSGKSFVTVYFEEDFKGKSVRLEAHCELNNDTLMKKEGIPNDSIQSLKVPEGYTVTLYSDAGFKGTADTFTGKAPKLGEMKALTSSLKVEATSAK